MTRAEQIRQLSDEDMAAFLCGLFDSCDVCPACKSCHTGFKGFRDWVKEEVSLWDE